MSGKPVLVRLLGLALCLWAYLGLNAPASAQDYGFAPVSGQMTSPFGWRVDPMTGASRFHGGIDIAAASGAPVYAPQAGYVMFSGYYGGYGNVVVINHGNSLYTLYGHNSQLLVAAGASVARGQLISLVGSTGRSTGPHLHFEVHFRDQYMNPLTYLAYFQQPGGSAGPMPAQGTAPAVTVAHAYRVSLANEGAGGSHRNKPASTGGRKKVVQRRLGKPGGKSVELLSGGEVDVIEF